MAKNGLRISAAILMFLVMFIVDACQRQVDEAFPGGATASLSVSLRQSTASRADVLEVLGQTSSEQGWTAKVVPDTQDFLHGRSLYYVGDRPQGRSAVEWYDSRWHGDWVPAAELGTASLDGVYVSAAPPEAVEELAASLRGTGAEVNVDHVRPLRVLTQTVVQAGFGVSVTSGVVLLLIVTTSWSVSRARRRSLRLLNGTSPLRIQFDEAVTFLRAVLPRSSSPVSWASSPSP